MLWIFNKPRAYPAVYAPYEDRLDFYNGRAAWLASCEGVPVKAVHLYCVHWAHIEIFNGGFWQYFFNSTGVTAPEARDGFKAIGMPAVATLLQNAMDRVGTPYPFDRETRQKFVGDPDDRMDFSTEDELFYEAADTPRVFRRVPRFVPFADAYAKAL